MRKNTKALTITGLTFLFISLACFVFADKLDKQYDNISFIAIAVSMGLSIIFFGISTNLSGKGDHLLLKDLRPGKEYILIDHVSINGSRSFSLIGTPGSEKYITIHGNDDLYEIDQKQSFIIVKGSVRKLT